MACLENCRYNQENIGWRTIRAGELATSFVSRPWFREGHCLVIPNRHITTLEELTEQESSALLREAGRLAARLDKGYGHGGILQKHQPLQPEGIKVNHLHLHVAPRHKEESGLFVVPEPNSFEGFVMPSDSEVIAVAESLR